ncbi:MAG TPA: efflux transporter outer membrane subunit [Methylocystis sp.]|nr:efflux transporter outer membrane subunit [Methylocystis sp.]
MRASARFLARLAVAPLAAASLYACTVGPDFVKPDPALPSRSFLGKPEPPIIGEPPPPSLDAKWWRQFHDPILASLVERVCEANLDVQIATTRLQESRAQRNSAASALFPGINSSAQYQRELYSSNGVFSLGKQFLSATGSTAANEPLSIPPVSVWQVGFDASWELDLWGRVRRSVEAAQAQVESLEFQRRDTLISTIAELARDYADLRGAEAQIAIAKANLASAEDIARLTRTRANGGVATYLDVENAQAQAESVRAQLPTLINQQSAMIDAIGQLLDEQPQALRGALAHTGPMLFTPPHAPLGVASDLARRRPDIRRTEASLHAAVANIGEAIGEFYPRVTLNGNVEMNALDARKLFEGKSLQYQFGPTVSLPIFDGGRLKSQLQLRDAQAQEAAITYHKTVLSAWTEVVDSLVAYRTEQARRARLHAQAAHQREALKLARARYENGVADFILVLDAERTLLQAELQEAQSATLVAENFVRLYKALGGGWEETFPVPPPLPTPLPDLTPPPSEIVAPTPLPMAQEDSR